MNLKDDSFEYNNEKIFIKLFLLIVIFSQAMRGSLNNIFNVSVFNYHLIPIIIIFFLLIFNRNSISLYKTFLISIIMIFLIVSLISSKYNIQTFLRTIISFFFPISILLIEFNKFDVKYFIRKFIPMFNLYIYVSVVISIVIFTQSEYFKRTGSIIGHPLTAGWYYAIFIALNIIYCENFSKQNNIKRIINISIALIGAILTTGRVATICVVLLGIVYITRYTRRKKIIFLIFCITIILLANSEFVNHFIWEKFRTANSWGDFTNGRLLGLREMKFFDIYPNMFIGNGLGYANYLTNYVFGTLNFENPIVMFSFDYGIFTVLLLILLIFIMPIKEFICQKNYVYIYIYTIVTLIPFTYNGIAETGGLWIVLLFISKVFLIVNKYKGKEEGLYEKR